MHPCVDGGWADGLNGWMFAWKNGLMGICLVGCVECCMLGWMECFVVGWIITHLDVWMSVQMAECERTGWIKHRVLGDVDTF